METTEPTYGFRLNREDAERVISALRMQAALLKDSYQNEYEVLGNNTYVEMLWDEYGIYSAIADDIEFVLPE